MLWVTMEVGTFSSSMYASKNRNHKHILPLGVEANESSQRLNTRFAEGDELFEWSKALLVLRSAMCCLRIKLSQYFHFSKDIFANHFCYLTVYLNIYLS